MMERTIRETDIARMSALKDAIQLVSEFKDNLSVEGTDGVITTTLRIADKLYDWILLPVEQLQDADADEQPERESHDDEEASEYSGPKRISDKQFGYLCNLYKQLGEKPDYDTLKGLSSTDASDLIKDTLYLVQKNGGNGNGRSHRNGR